MLGTDAWLPQAATSAARAGSWKWKSRLRETTARSRNLTSDIEDIDYEIVVADLMSAERI
jgi:hypothetical protein